MPPLPPGTQTRDLSTPAARLQAMVEALNDRVRFEPGPNAQSPADAPVVTSRRPGAALGQRAFGPLMPLAPQYGPDSAEASGPRQFQYPMGVNTILTPRREYPDLVPFEQLDNLSRAYDVAAMCIATRIEEIQGMAWSITARDKRKQRQYQAVCDEVAEFFRRPDRVTPFETWIGQIIREHLVTDAVTVYPRLDRGGRLYALEVVDGSTIKPLLDDQGRTRAYQQVLYGQPFSEYERPHSDELKDEFPTFGTTELLYLPRFTNTRTPYGSPPSEWIILRVNQALRKQLFDLAYFTEGNIPDMLATLPDDSLSPDQVKEFEEYFNAVLAGNDAARRKMRFIPWGANVQELRPFTYETVLDEWMLRVTCAAYAVPPQELGFTQDVNRATAELQEAVNERRGLKPLATWLKRALLDEVIHNWFGRGLGEAGRSVSYPGAPTKPESNPYKEVGWDWSFGDKTDANTQAQTDQAYLDSKVISPDEVRAMRFGGELEGPSPATLEAQAAALRAGMPGAADAELVQAAGGGELGVPGAGYPIDIVPVPGAEATPLFNSPNLHRAGSFPIPMEPTPGVGKAIDGGWQRDWYELAIRRRLGQVMDLWAARLARMVVRDPTKAPGDIYGGLIRDMRTALRNEVEQMLRAGLRKNLPPALLEELHVPTFEHDLLAAGAVRLEDFLADNLSDLRLAAKQTNSPQVGRLLDELAGQLHTLLDNLPATLALNTLGKAAGGEGKLVMAPPRHINCRCKIRVRKVAWREPARPPSAPARPPTPSNVVDETDEEEGQFFYYAQDVTDLRKAEEGLWVGVWWTDYEDACTTLYKVPWGGVVEGCRGLKNICVSAGPLLGRRV